MRFLKYLFENLLNKKICYNLKDNSATNNKKLFENIRALKKQTDTSSNFIRKGKIGGYREEMSQELIDRFNEWNLQSDKLNQGYLYKSGD